MSSTLFVSKFEIFNSIRAVVKLNILDIFLTFFVSKLSNCRDFIEQQSSNI